MWFFVTDGFDVNDGVFPSELGDSIEVPRRKSDGNLEEFWMGVGSPFEGRRSKQRLARCNHVFGNFNTL